MTQHTQNVTITGSLVDNDQPDAPPVDVTLTGTLTWEDAIAPPEPEPPPDDNPHAYFEQLRARPDCLAAYSLRDPANAGEGLEHRVPLTVNTEQMSYLYPHDPDPRQQDAMKVRMPEGWMGLEQMLNLPTHRDKLGTAGQSLLIAFDFWFGAEFAHAHSRLDLHKGTPIVVVVEGDELWAGLRADYRAATEWVSHLPPGGPFVAMTYPQCTGKGKVVKTDQYGGTNWIDGMEGYPRVTLPYDVPEKERRGYTESIAPICSTVDPGGQEVGVVAETWTRYWLYFERDETLDWVTQHSNWAGQLLAAYKWSLWFADVAREPLLVVDQAVIGCPKSWQKHITRLRCEFAAGNSNVDSKYEGRGDLVAYTRNWACLHGTAREDVLGLLQRPTGRA